MGNLFACGIEKFLWFQMQIINIQAYHIAHCVWVALSPCVMTCAMTCVMTCAMPCAIPCVFYKVCIDIQI